MKHVKPAVCSPFGDVSKLTVFETRGDLLLPRVEHGHPCLVEIAPVACDDRKPVVKGGRRKHEVGV